MFNKKSLGLWAILWITGIGNPPLPQPLIHPAKPDLEPKREEQDEVMNPFWVDEGEWRSSQIYYS